MRLALFLACVLAFAAALFPASDEKGKVVVTGVLVNKDGNVALKAAEKIYRLETDSEDDRETLGDERLDGLKLQVEGQLAAGDAIKVSRFLSVRDGKLYRVTYYCDVCNLTAFAPGPCRCCQQPVEPREVPYDPNDPLYPAR